MILLEMKIQFYYSILAQEIMNFRLMVLIFRTIHYLQELHPESIWPMQEIKMDVDYRLHMKCMSWITLVFLLQMEMVIMMNGK